MKDSDFLWREYKRLTDAIIEGDYMGPLRGETNCALYVIHYLKALEDVLEKELGSQEWFGLHDRAIARRQERWPERLGW